MSVPLAVPAQIFTIALAFAPTLPLALTLFVLRASIVSMDSSVRGAFLAAVIPKESRTRFLGSAFSFPWSVAAFTRLTVFLHSSHQYLQDARLCPRPDALPQPRRSWWHALVVRHHGRSQVDLCGALSFLLPLSFPFLPLLRSSLTLYYRNRRLRPLDCVQDRQAGALKALFAFSFYLISTPLDLYILSMIRSRPTYRRCIRIFP